MNDDHWKKDMMLKTKFGSRYHYALATGLLLFGLTLPLSKSAGNVLLFLIYLTAVAGVLLNENLKKSIHANIRQPVTIAFALYFLVAIVGVLFTENYSDGFHIANKYFSLPAIYLMVSVLIQSLYGEKNRIRSIEYILLSFLVGLAVLNVIGVMTFLGVIGNKRFVTPMVPMNVHHIWFSNINALGLYTAASLALFSQWGRDARNRLFLYLAMVLGLVCILLAISRTAWFGIALTLMIMAFLMNKSKRLFFITVGVTALAGITAYLFVPLVHERINLIARDITFFWAGKTETSLGTRFLMWKAAMQMFLSNPLVGVGTGDYGPTLAAYVASGAFPAFLLDYNQPHNMYLFALATNGIMGLAALLFVFYRSLKFTVPLLRGPEGQRMCAFLGAATAVHFLIAGFTDSFFNIQILRYAFVFLIGVCVRTTVGPTGRG